MGLSLINALMPSKLPGGKLKKYISNKNPKEDIIVIDRSRASIISRNWLENILNYEINKKINERTNSMNHDNHIVMKINELETLIQDNTEYIYLSWMPKCIYGSKDVLFLIVCQYIDDMFNVKLVIQSPFWSHDQIKSQMLKDALCDYTNNKINLNELYNNDIRYKLSWSTWCLQNQNN